MEWGIINKENFSEDKNLPIKRWDPLSTVEIQAKEFGYRQDHRRFYGHYSYISPIRGTRPKGFSDPGKKRKEYEICSEKLFQEPIDIFTSVTEGKPIYKENGSQLGDGYTIIVSEDDKRRDNPFSKEPHKIERLPDNCKACTLINRYPAMARVIDHDIRNKIEKKNDSRLSVGINLVTISREFYPSLCFHKVPEEILTGIFNSMKTAIIYCVQEAIERDYYDIPISPFFNIGKKVGGSQPRVHSQVYIDLAMDGHGSRLDGYLNAFKEMGDACHLCKTSHSDTQRIILETAYWTFYVTASPVRNYHLRFYPKEHIRRFSQLKINQYKDLSVALKKVFKALDDIDVNENRNIIFNSCPFGYDANFHLFADIIPYEIIGGAEMADNMRVARRLPESIAEEIKSVL
jgi:UDPglucose--hexose-1-phosphate uridylyltransferase